MLSEKSVPGPKFKDPMTKVRVVAPIRFYGNEYKDGDIVSIPLSDAQALRNSIPSPIEIL